MILDGFGFKIDIVMYDKILVEYVWKILFFEEFILVVIDKSKCFFRVNEFF